MSGGSQKPGLRTSPKPPALDLRLARAKNGEVSREGSKGEAEGSSAGFASLTGRRRAEEGLQTAGSGEEEAARKATIDSSLRFQAPSERYGRIAGLSVEAAGWGLRLKPAGLIFHRSGQVATDIWNPPAPSAALLTAREGVRGR